MSLDRRGALGTDVGLMRRMKLPRRVWETAAVSDSLLILGVGANGLPYPPNAVTNVVSTAITLLAFGSAVAYWLLT